MVEEDEESEETMMIDAHLFAKIETYKTMVEDQARNPELEYYPKRHLVSDLFSFFYFFSSFLIVVFFLFLLFSGLRPKSPHGIQNIPCLLLSMVRKKRKRGPKITSSLYHSRKNPKILRIRM